MQKKKILKKIHAYEKLLSPVLVGTAVFLLVIFITLQFDLHIRLKNIFSNKQEEVILTQLQGKMINPKTSQDVAGMDLTVGDDAVRVDDGGEYNFDLIKDADGVKITHPELHRSIFKIIEGDEKMNIYFDVDLFNQLIGLVNLEAVDKYEKIYELLDTHTATKVSKVEFTQSYTDIVERANMSDQVLIITKINTVENYKNNYSVEYTDAVEIEVSTNDILEKYYFVDQDDKWLFVGKDSRH